MTIGVIRRRGLGKVSLFGHPADENTKGSLGITGHSKHDWEVVRSWREDKFSRDADFIIRWGCTSTIRWEGDYRLGGRRIFNLAANIHLASDKVGFRFHTETMGDGIAPKTWFHADDLQYPLTAPVLVRKGQHAQGRDMHLCHDEASVRAACGLYDTYYISEYIEKVQEFRVVMVGGRVAFIAEKFPENAQAIAWNLAQGGKFGNVRWGQWNLDVVNVANKAFKLSGLDFGGVDVIVDKDGRPYVLEINSAPTVVFNYFQECMAKCFDYHYSNIDAELPINNLINWRDVIHPAVSAEARI